MKCGLCVCTTCEGKRRTGRWWLRGSVRPPYEEGGCRDQRPHVHDHGFEQSLGAKPPLCSTHFSCPRLPDPQTRFGISQNLPQPRRGIPPAVESQTHRLRSIQVPQKQTNQLASHCRHLAASSTEDMSPASPTRCRGHTCQHGDTHTPQTCPGVSKADCAQRGPRLPRTQRAHDCLTTRHGRCPAPVSPQGQLRHTVVSSRGGVATVPLRHYSRGGPGTVPRAAASREPSPRFCSSMLRVSTPSDTD